MNSGRRRGFTDLIIRSLGAAASAALPVAGETAGVEGLCARLRGSSPLRPGVHAPMDSFGQAAECKQP